MLIFGAGGLQIRQSGQSEERTGKMSIEGARADLQFGRCEYKDF